MLNVLKRLAAKYGPFARKNIDYVVTFFLAVLVAGLHVFHQLEYEYVAAATLFVLAMLSYGGIHDRDLREKAIEQTQRIVESVAQMRSKAYEHRRESRSDRSFHNDMAMSAHLVFIGSTQENLHQYLRDAIATSNNLPWERVDVYFSRSDITGLAKHEFEKRRHLARLQVAALLTDPAYRARLGKFEEVRFFVYDEPASFTGSLFYHRMAGHESPVLSAAYVTHSRVVGTNLDEVLTLRLVPGWQGRELEKTLNSCLQEYDGKIRAPNRNVFSAGTYRIGSWDDSAEAWSDFVRLSSAHRNGMARLVELANIDAADRVLDLGSGTGELAAQILKRVTPQKYVMLDGSPRMLDKARLICPNAEFALFEYPEHGATVEEIDLTGQEFSIILIHHSLREFVKERELLDLTRWCYEHLSESGRLILAAHNSDIETEIPPAWANKPDAFFEKVAQAIHTSRGELFRERSRKFRQGDISDAICAAGFKLRNMPEQVEFRFTMTERIALWKVKAIRDKEVSPHHASAVERVLKAPPESLKSADTMPRWVTYWVAEK